MSLMNEVDNTPTEKWNHLRNFSPWNFLTNLMSVIWDSFHGLYMTFSSMSQMEKMLTIN